MTTVEPKPFTEDQIAYLKQIEESAYHPDKICDECGARLGDHVIGGPGPFHPKPINK